MQPLFYLQHEPAKRVCTRKQRCRSPKGNDKPIVLVGKEQYEHTTHSAEEEQPEQRNEEAIQHCGTFFILTRHPCGGRKEGNSDERYDHDSKNRHDRSHMHDLWIEERGMPFLDKHQMEQTVSDKATLIIV